MAGFWHAEFDGSLLLSVAWGNATTPGRNSAVTAPRDLRKDKQRRPEEIWRFRSRLIGHQGGKKKAPLTSSTKHDYKHCYCVSKQMQPSGNERLSHKMIRNHWGVITNHELWGWWWNGLFSQLVCFRLPVDLWCFWSLSLQACFVWITQIFFHHCWASKSTEVALTQNLNGALQWRPRGRSVSMFGVGGTESQILCACYLHTFGYSATGANAFSFAPIMNTVLHCQSHRESRGNILAVLRCP